MVSEFHNSSLSKCCLYLQSNGGSPTFKQMTQSVFQLNGFLLSLYPSELLAEDAGLEHNRSVFSGVTLAHNVGSGEEVEKLLASAKELDANISKSAELKD